MFVMAEAPKETKEDAGEKEDRRRKESAADNTMDKYWCKFSAKHIILLLD